MAKKKPASKKPVSKIPSGKPKTKKQSSKVVKKTKKVSATGTKAYHEWLREFSKYYKENDLKIKGRGNFVKKAAEIYQGTKDQPDAIQNSDLIIPQYVGPTEGKEFDNDLYQAILETGLNSFNWWDGSGNFGRLFGLPEWGPNHVLRIVDQNNDFRDCWDVTQYRNKVQRGLSRDYRTNKFDDKSKYPDSQSISYNLEEINEEGKYTYVTYSISLWTFEDADFGDEEIEEEPRKKKEEEPIIPEKEPKEVKPEVDIKTKLDILKSRKQDLREDVRFYKEMEMKEEQAEAMKEYKITEAKIKVIMNKL